MTIKQEIALEKTLENRGNVSKAMREAGYRPSTAKNPKNLTESKGWNEMMDDYISDRKLLQLHARILEKKERIVFGNSSVLQPHGDALRSLDLAYKIKGKLRYQFTLNEDKLPMDSLWKSIKESYDL